MFVNSAGKWGGGGRGIFSRTLCPISRRDSHRTKFCRPYLNAMTIAVGIVLFMCTSLDIWRDDRVTWR